LFNSLTALKILIEESPDLAKQYVNHLSQVLRYTLQSKRKQLVTLEEELEFTESYIFLLKMRYDTNLSVKTDISKEFSFYQLPPLTIQTLVENAVKHNEISNEFPFEIKICTTENATLQVINKIQEKLTPEDGTGIGLTNLSKLFSLLGEKEIQIFKDEHEFKVEVPLIKP
jgi:LytS/YehU family sensor histidine kinase